MVGAANVRSLIRPECTVATLCQLCCLCAASNALVVSVFVDYHLICREAMHSKAEQSGAVHGGSSGDGGEYGVEHAGDYDEEEDAVNLSGDGGGQ